MELTEFNRIMGQRRAGVEADEVPPEVVSEMMSHVASQRMPWTYGTSGRPRTVVHTEEGRCTCVECRKGRGHYPGVIQLGSGGE